MTLIRYVQPAYHPQYDGFRDVCGWEGADS